MNPAKIFSEIKLKNYESVQTKKLSTPMSAKRKKEDDEKVRKLGNPSGFPKRKNSIHASDHSGSKGGSNVGLMSLLRKFGEGYHLLCMYHCL